MVGQIFVTLKKQKGHLSVSWDWRCPGPLTFKPSGNSENRRIRVK